MKITMTLNGVKVEKQIPTSWKDVSFKQFLELSKCHTVTDKLSLFTGIDPATLQKARITNLSNILQILSFTEVTPEVDRLPVEIAGYRIPQNLEIESIGQFEDLKLEAAKIKEDDHNTLEVYALFCAIYATEPYDYKKATELKDVFLNAPCEEVMAIGNFTLLKLIGLRGLGAQRTLRPTSVLRNWRLAIRGWLSRLAFTARYYSWRRKLRLTEKSY